MFINLMKKIKSIKGNSLAEFAVTLRITLLGNLKIYIAKLNFLKFVPLVALLLP